jgi:hypothetical protein
MDEEGREKVGRGRGEREGDEATSPFNCIAMKCIGLPHPLGIALQIVE